MMRTSAVSLLFALSTNCFAQRAAPVEPIIYENKIEIRVPHYKLEGMSHNGGYVELIDKVTGKRLCLSKVYNVVYSTAVDQNLQENFIESIRLKGELLVVMNERGERIKIPVSYLCD